MIANFIKRIVSEAIKELITPQLEELKKSMDEKIAQLRESMDEKIAQLRESMEKGDTLLREDIKDIREELRGINRRIDDLFKVVVRREEHEYLLEELKRLREDVETLKRKVFVS